MIQFGLVIGAGLVGIILAWWLIGRWVKQSSSLRLILRLGAMVGIGALVFLSASGLTGNVPAVPGGTGAVQSSPLNTLALTPTDTTIVQQGTLTITLNSTGVLSPVQQVELAFERSAPVVEVLVAEGQRVEAGDVLARIDSADAQSTVRNSELALAQAQATYDNLTQPPRDVDLAVVQAQVTLAQASLYSASLTGPDSTDDEIARLNAELASNRLWQSQLNRDIQLAPNPEFRNQNGGAQAGEISANSQVESQEYNAEIQEQSYNDTLNSGPDASALGSANASLAQAQAELENLMNPVSEAALRRAQIDLETAQLDLQKAQEQLSQTILTAPIGGVIADENLTVGEVPPNSNAITLIDDSHYTIDLAIDETDIVDVAVGQKVTLNVVALPDATITGMVTKIDSAPTIDGQLVTYAATATLDFTPAPLRPNMSATATIATGEVQDVILVPNRFIRVDNETQRTYVTVQDDGGYRDVPVTLGVRNESDSQILSGLQAGQMIVLLPSQAQSQGQGGGLFGGGAPGAGAGAGG